MSVRYFRGPGFAADMARYIRLLNEDGGNTRELGRTRQALCRAIREDLTPRQRQCLTLYYVQRMNMGEIGEALGVDKSTVSRTIKRGETRLRRCLRYGAGRLLEEEEPT